MMNMRYKQRQAGVTIAEVVIAMAILLVGVYAVLRVFPAGLNTIETTTFNDIATRLNQQRLDAYRTQPSLAEAFKFSANVRDFLPPQIDRLSGALLHQPLTMPDAVVFVTVDNRFLPYGEGDVDNNGVNRVRYYTYQIQPDFLPENRSSPPPGCIAPDDPDAPLCHAMAAWKRVIGETHVVQQMTATDTSQTPPTPFTFSGIILSHAPIYFNPSPGSSGDVLNPVFYKEVPVPVTTGIPPPPGFVGVNPSGLLDFTSLPGGGTFKVSYRWLNKDLSLQGIPPVMHGVSEETFTLQSTDYTVAAAASNSQWDGFVPGSVYVVKIVSVPGEPLMKNPPLSAGTPLYRTDSVGLIQVAASPGTVLKANYTVHVVRDGSNNLQPVAWRSIIEEFKLLPDNQCVDRGNAHFQPSGKTQVLFKNLSDTATAYFLRQEGQHMSFALDSQGNPGIPGAELRTGVSQVLLDASDGSDSTLLFGSLLNGGCPAPPFPSPPTVQPRMRAVLTSLHDWSNWTEVAAKTYTLHCPNDVPLSTPTTPLDQSCRSRPPGQTTTDTPQPYREYRIASGTDLEFHPSEVGKTVAVDYVWLDTNGVPHIVSGEVHTVSDFSGKFGFSLQHRFAGVLQVRGVSVKAHTSWSSSGRYRQVITSGYRVPPQEN